MIGEQLRAVLQNRDRRWQLDAESAVVHPSSLDEVLRHIAQGRTSGPVKMLGDAYHRAWTDERAALETVGELLEAHPAWPWMSRIRGIGYSVAGRLLARLDLAKAPRASSFWAYCGLHTVAGKQYTCDGCGARLLYLDAQRPLHHVRPGTKVKCTHTLRADPEPIRIAPRPVRGESLRYDRDARVACYLLALSLSRQGGTYKAAYQAQRERLQTRSDWPLRRQRLTALRITSKLFLVHLWLVWREAIGEGVHYRPMILANELLPNPWAMVDR